MEVTGISEVRKNNKLWIIVIAMAFLVIISVGCNETTVVMELEDDDVFELYNKAKEGYEWFDLTTIPYDNEKYIEIDGVTYYEVVQPGIDSKKALSEYLNELFVYDITEELMTASANRYVEHEGKLYVIPADRGTDIFKGAESYELVRVSDKEIKFTVTVEIYDDPDQKNIIGYEDYDFFLEFSDNRWRFKNFELVR